MDVLSVQERQDMKSTDDYNRLSSQISKSDFNTDSEIDHTYAVSDRIQLNNQTIGSLMDLNRSNNGKNTQNSTVEDNPAGKYNTMAASRPLPPVDRQNNAPNNLIPVHIPTYYNYLTESSTDAPMTQESNERRLHSSEDRELPEIPNSTVRGRNIALSSGDTRNHGLSRNNIISSSNKATREVESQRVQNFNGRYRKCLAFLCISVLTSLVIVGSTLGGVVLVGYRIQDRIQGAFSRASDNMAAMLEESHANLTKRVGALCSTTQVVSDLRILYTNNCYCLYRRKLSWFEAREFCLNLGNEVHLAEIHDTRTNDLLLPIFQHSSVNDGIWLGGSDLVEEGKWVWNYTGTSLETFSMWEPGQPSGDSHLNVPEHCLYLYKWNVPNFMWNDHVCNDIKPFVCMSAHENSKCYC